MPMLYYTGKIDQLEEQSQKNLGKFMKILLVKRLESSFYAFKTQLIGFWILTKDLLKKWKTATYM